MGEPVTRPLKVEEGLLLAVMEVAANKANVELAEATWQVRCGRHAGMRAARRLPAGI